MAIPHSVLDYSSIEPYWYRYYLPNDTNSELITVVLIFVFYLLLVFTFYIFTSTIVKGVLP